MSSRQNVDRAHVVGVSGVAVVHAGKRGLAVPVFLGNVPALRARLATPPARLHEFSSVRNPHGEAKFGVPTLRFGSIIVSKTILYSEH